MHYVSLGYPEHPTATDKNHYKDFYESLQNILPCSACSQNYTLNLREIPIDKSLDSRDDLIKWVTDIHNKVNQETGKTILDHEEALSLYLKQPSPLSEYGFKILILVVILVFLYYLMK